MATVKSATPPRFKRRGARRERRHVGSRSRRGESEPRKRRRRRPPLFVHRPLSESAILPPPRKLLRRDDVVLRITEVEAYRANDTACHGRFGVTSGRGGHAYVYMCYGIHMMLNVVADKEGVGAAVLIRSCAPVSGLATIQQRRKQRTDKPILLTGPGKVHWSSPGLSTSWSNHPLYVPAADGPAPEGILVGPRVGIDYASPEHVAAPWRFAAADSPWISAPRTP
ncbi:unnamed protein product [Spirodela intermedia]|uniref:DNA-3-methyladenine glycosylase II n=1 Tax=Spirodela intermedia TaxID=51605 RepID=A0A7I8IZ37_SPIIN|nr:unnamed protein product [Spirodela intermedia]CAA6662404.1 unnamed protein product [Spirodela intermedia]